MAALPRVLAAPKPSRVARPARSADGLIGLALAFSYLAHPALDLVRAKPQPDLILLDVTMSEMAGYEVCGILKATPDARDIPVIFLTGKTEADDETKGFEAGAVDYIHKPFSPAVMKARVHTHLVLREAREQLARQLLDINNELEMAREIQLSILPQEIPKIRGLEIAARYIPMRSVAGDLRFHRR
jgi:phosphoserine phosphatase RsbU/P